MATLEQVEKLRQHANVSYDEAKSALEACGDDLLEAIIYLERQGKTASPKGGYYSTKYANLSVHQGGGRDYGEPTGESFKALMSRFWNWIKKVVHMGNVNQFEVWHKGERAVSLPVTVLVLLLVFCFWITLPLMVVGLFFSCNYRFRGSELENSGVNNVMDSAAKAADGIKTEVQNVGKEYKNSYDKNNYDQNHHDQNNN